ncbi:hypothetical protein BDN72DRAFT_735896, partial [Pluteus cervinus]
MADAKSNSDDPFGGMNMVFAGDFAQLPPVSGGEGGALYTRSFYHAATKLHEQRKALGKGLWHQVTTVVILRQNMRQATQSPEDAKFRTALVNMRYKACTDDDIAFLKSKRHHKAQPNGPKITDKKFRNVSIITSWNLSKDGINDLGSKRFALETGQELVDFYSEDVLYVPDLEKMKPKQRKKYKPAKAMPPHVQDALWTQPVSACKERVAGCLSLCIGMPVIIRTNLATELCITKGQEGFVYNWIEGTGSKGQRILQVLFVKLANPPQTVQFDGLPVNVVPVYKTTERCMVNLPKGSDVSISRTQVQVLVGFSMTDYASQGKTRPYNPVHIENSRTHQHIYTALSRGCSADGTLILGDFSEKKITGGIDGALRQ